MTRKLALLTCSPFALFGSRWGQLPGYFLGEVRVETGEGVASQLQFGAADNSSSNVLAPLRSSVSKPSVNHP
jgi:hypothetical protein